MGRSPDIAGGMLGEPYGGKLTDNLLPPGKAEGRLREAREMPGIRPFDDFIYDAEKIGVGAYSPLEGFMDEESFSSVVEKNMLPNGLPWTVPIFFAPKDHGEIREGDEVALLDWDSSPFAILDVAQKFRYSKTQLAFSVYGTTDPKHPNVNDILTSYGETVLAGKLTLLRTLRHPTGMTDPTPGEIRAAFTERGWWNVVAYQCRNPPHSAHEYIQKCALEVAEIDGLFIQPVVGRLKRGDYKPEIIMEAYAAVVEKYYPKDRVLLAPLSISMRYAGPKASLFFAIVRKNFGATHYIVGRDQAGVGGYYDPYECHRIFDKYDVGITPLRFAEAFFCKACGWTATEKTCPHPADMHVSISQTKLRELLREGRPLPSEIIRPEVARILSRPDVIIP